MVCPPKTRLDDRRDFAVWRLMVEAGSPSVLLIPVIVRGKEIMKFSWLPRQSQNILNDSRSRPNRIREFLLTGVDQKPSQPKAILDRPQDIGSVRLDGEFWRGSHDYDVLVQRIGTRGHDDGRFDGRSRPLYIRASPFVVLPND